MSSPVAVNNTPAIIPPPSASSSSSTLNKTTFAGATGGSRDAVSNLKQDDLEFMFSVMSDSASQSKLLASLLLFVLTMLCGYLPVRTVLNQKYIQLAIFAGGGVLMATAFCHLIPEAHDNFKLEGSLQHQHHHDHDHQPHEETHTKTIDEHVDVSDNRDDHLVKQLNNDTIHSEIADKLNVHQEDHVGHPMHIPYVEIFICFGFFFIYLSEALMVRFINIHTHTHPCDSSMSQLVGTTNLGPTRDTPLSSTTDLTIGNQARLNSSTTLSTVSGGVNNRTTSSSSSGTQLYKFIRGFLIVSAFIIHSLFDGVAIGSQEKVGEVWTVFFAISCHKLIIAAVVGFELFSATLESHFWTLVHLSIFSIMSPLGIILVMVAQNSLQIASNDPTMVLLQAFAAGTLLYIVFIEILQPKEDQACEKNRLGKSVCLVFGFVLMTVVLTFTDVH